MENASKALIIAGGVLLTMLIVALLLFGYKSMSEYYANEEKLQAIEDVEKFNAQFIGFDRNDITGSEIITLINKVADYNFRYSNASDAKNDFKYSPISVTIDFVKDDYRKKLLYVQNLSDGQRLFTENKYIDNGVTNKFEKTIKQAIGTEFSIGNASIASKLARDLDSVVIDNKNKAENIYGKPYNKLSNAEKELIKKIYVDSYKRITGKNDVNSYSDVEGKIGIGGSNLYKYYEYIQFQRAIFKCTEFEHDDRTGRVSKISFEFTGILK